jgi:hypothetical protein
MSSISVAVPHQLDPQEATARIQSALAEALRTYQDRLEQASFQWADRVLTYRFQTMGVAVHGTLRVEPAQVVVAAELPAFAGLFRGMIEQQIRDRLSELLA